MSRSHLALGLLFLAASTGLLAAEQEQPIGGEARQSIDQVDSASGVQSEAFDASELWAMTFTNTVLTIDLLRSLPPNENVFFSPMGVSELLSMALEGAGGETRNRMLEFLEKRWAKQGVNLQAGLDPAQLGRMMHRAVEDLAGSDSLAFKVGNSIWSLPPLKPGFSQTVEHSFNADLVEVDPTFPAMKPEILEWISRQTNGKGVFPSELLAEPLLRILMINTLYLNAPWESPFSVDATTNRPFHRLDGSIVQAPMMLQTMHARYGRWMEWELLELPYLGREVSACFLLPSAPGDVRDAESAERAIKAGTLAEVEQLLHVWSLCNNFSNLSPVFVDVVIPRFSIDSKVRVDTILKSLGLTQPFGPKADFSRMTSERDIALGPILQNAAIDLNEKGTEAVAVTAGAMFATGIQSNEPWFEIRLDHPFLFFLRDNATGTILFAGRVVDPLVGLKPPPERSQPEGQLDLRIQGNSD